MLAVLAQNMLRKFRLRWRHVKIIRRRGKCQERSNSTTRGDSMPAFTFEKISPPRRGPIAPIVKKQRGLVVAILHRFVDARVKRAMRQEKRPVERDNAKTQSNFLRSRL